MKTLIVGASGFVGAHLIHELTAHGHSVFAASIEADFTSVEVPRERTIAANIEDPGQIANMLRLSDPEWIVNLAAQSSVSQSWVDPIRTARVNVLGPVGLLEGVRKANLHARFLMIGSSEEYGEVGSGEQVDEKVRLAPNNPYAITKYAQELFSSTYATAYGMDIVLARPFPHSGPGQQRGFVVPDFCAQIAEAERDGVATAIHVGNLDSSRDLSDVRDVVRGYRLLLESGTSGQAYNIGSGKALRTGEILDFLLSRAHRRLRTEVAPQMKRPIDVPTIVADTTRIRSATGWTPEIPLEQTLTDTLEYWRKQVSRT
jgi:GDP-4-dehydro-6-deoxy-D-mannose reductase